LGAVLLTVIVIVLLTITAAVVVLLVLYTRIEIVIAISNANILKSAISDAWVELHSGIRLPLVCTIAINPSKTVTLIVFHLLIYYGNGEHIGQC